MLTLHTCMPLLIAHRSPAANTLPRPARIRLRTQAVYRSPGQSCRVAELRASICLQAAYYCATRGCELSIALCDNYDAASDLQRVLKDGITRDLAGLFVLIRGLPSEP